MTDFARPPGSLVFPSAAASGYSLSATAKAASPQFADSKCRVLTVVLANGEIGYRSTDAGGTVDTTNTNRCWAR